MSLNILDIENTEVFRIRNGLDLPIFVNSSGNVIIQANDVDQMTLTSSLITYDGITVVNGQILADDGTATDPSITFQDDTDQDSGLYLIGSSNIGVSIATTKEMDISSSGVDFISGISLNGGTTLTQRDQGAWSSTLSNFSNITGGGGETVTGRYHIQNGIVEGWFLVTGLSISSLPASFRASLPVNLTNASDIVTGFCSAYDAGTPTGVNTGGVGTVSGNTTDVDVFLSGSLTGAAEIQVNIRYTVQ